MSILDIVEIGRQGLNANREALQTTSNNIANANTPGYTRQRAVLHANANSQVGGARLGGVQLKDVIRVHDGFVQNQLIDESKSYGAAKTRSESMHRLEDLVSGESFRVGDRITGFFNAVRELSANPETAVLRSNVVSAARATAETFRNLSGHLKGLQNDLDAQLEVQVSQINAMTKELADLNGTMAEVKARGDTPLELADRREELLRQLSSKLGFQLTYDDQDNANIVAAGGIGVLVNGSQAHELTVSRTEARPGKAAGSLDIFVKEGDFQRPVSQHITDGEIGGLLYVRDAIINPALQHLDDTAHQFANSVNEVHRQGVGIDGVGGRDLFKVSENRLGAAETLDVSDAMKQTSENLAVAVNPGTPGDNRIALQLADMQDLKVYSDNPDALPGNRPKTINESMDGLVGRIAIGSEQEAKNFEHQEAIINQLDNYRKSVAGVNLEEEAVNMMQYQTVFNASAKAMKVGDELMQTVLSLK